MKQIISTNKAPAAVGPYSQAIKVTGDTMIFCSMQIPLDSAENRIVGNTAAEQINQCLKNLQAVLTAAGAELKHVVKATIYLINMADFASINEVYARYFTMDKPARAALEVARLPKDVKVAVEAVAVL
jgi:2-iminobutanoate/2-iminopropanoate deaminase